LPAGGVVVDLLKIERKPMSEFKQLLDALVKPRDTVQPLAEDVELSAMLFYRDNFQTMSENKAYYGPARVKPEFFKGYEGQNDPWRDHYRARKCTTEELLKFEIARHNEIVKKLPLFFDLGQGEIYYSRLLRGDAEFTYSHDEIFLGVVLHSYQVRGLGLPVDPKANYKKTKKKTTDNNNNENNNDETKTQHEEKNNNDEKKTQDEKKDFNTTRTEANWDAAVTAVSLIEAALKNATDRLPKLKETRSEVALKGRKKGSSGKRARAWKAKEASATTPAKKKTKTTSKFGILPDDDDDDHDDHDDNEDDNDDGDGDDAINHHHHNNNKNNNNIDNNNNNNNDKNNNENNNWGEISKSFIETILVNVNLVRIGMRNRPKHKDEDEEITKNRERMMDVLERCKQFKKFLGEQDLKARKAMGEKLRYFAVGRKRKDRPEQEATEAPKTRRRTTAAQGKGTGEGTGKHTHQGARDEGGEHESAQGRVAKAFTRVCKNVQHSSLVRTHHLWLHNVVENQAALASLRATKKSTSQKKKEKKEKKI
jgi:hypothetical protein